MGRFPRGRVLLVTIGVDELRGRIETGLDLLLLGQARHLEGYRLLESLGDAPGVRARANSMTMVCLDREALEELGGVATEEVLAQLEDVDRVDCADLPGTPD